MNNLFSLRRTFSPSEDKNSFSRFFGRKCFGFFFACFPKISLLILGAFLLEGSLALASFEEEEIKQPKTSAEELIRDYQIGPEGISAFPSGQTGEDIYQEKNAKTLEKKNNVLWNPIFFMDTGKREDFSRSISSFEELVQSGRDVFLVRRAQKKEDLQIMAITSFGTNLKVRTFTPHGFEDNSHGKTLFEDFPLWRADHTIDENSDGKLGSMSWLFFGGAKRVLIENDKIHIAGWSRSYQGRNVSDSREPSLQRLGSSLSYDPEKLQEPHAMVQKDMISIPIKKTSEFHVKDFNELREHFLMNHDAKIRTKNISWVENTPYSFHMPVSQEMYDDRDGYSSAYKKPSPELFVEDEMKFSAKKGRGMKDSFVESLKTFGVGGFQNIQRKREKQARFSLWSENFLPSFKKNEKPY